jgi:hypothetical protein
LSAIKGKLQRASFSSPSKARLYFKLDDILAATSAKVQLHIILFPETVRAGARININTKSLGLVRKGNTGAAPVERRVPAEAFKFFEWPPTFQWHHRHQNRRALCLESACKFRWPGFPRLL